MTRQRVLGFAAEHDVDVSDRDSVGLDVNLWSPPGVAWFATGGHSLSGFDATDRARGWAELWSDVSAGLVRCELPGCEFCAEGG